MPTYIDILSLAHPLLTRTSAKYDLDEIDYAESYKELEKDYGLDKVKLPNGETIWVSEDKVVEGKLGDFSVYDKHDWVDSADALDMYPDTFSKDFWSSPSPLYHATQKRFVEDIQEDGLEGRSSSRGLSNRSVGSAVFTTMSLSEAEYGAYGNFIFQIDTRSMKKDRYTPEVGEEPDILENGARSGLAHLVGLDDYYYDIERGVSDQTVIVYGDIPAKYLTLI